ncbi:MAG: hypothetical protein KA319_03790 [Ferruginibacter sp.]|nr:hypothetical protein [Ferruginibacter sp.]
MKYHLFSISLFLILNSVCLSQNNTESNRAIFLNGVQFEKPDYNFKFNFKIEDIPKNRFLNYKVHKKGIGGGWTHIEFDSVYLNGFLLTHVIVKSTKRKNHETYLIKEFVGFIDFETRNKMAAYFGYDRKGWMYYPKEKPSYKFFLYKDKRMASIVLQPFKINS